MVDFKKIGHSLFHRSPKESLVPIERHSPTPIDNPAPETTEAAALPLPPEQKAEPPPPINPPTRKPHGSDKRQRTRGVMVRLTPAEREAIEDRARNAGLSTGAYLRACALGDSGPKSKRAPPVNRELLGEALASLNRIGNNVNQIAKHLNTGGHPDRIAMTESREALTACLQIIMKALGHQP